MGKEALIETELNAVVYFQEGPGLRTWQFGSEGIPFLNIKTFNNHLIDKSKCNFVKLEEFENKYEHFLLNESDIVVSSSGTIGKIARVRKVDLPLMLNTSVIRFRSRNEEVLLQAYLWFYLQSNHFINQIGSFKTGSAIMNYGPSHLNKMTILFPSLNEQKRIVAKLDQIMPRIGAVKERLDKVSAIIKRFRQSVLTAAVTGKLTEQWRDEHQDMNSAKELLDQVVKIKEDKFGTKCNLNITEGKRKPKNYFHDEEFSSLVDGIDLPSTWAITCVGNVSFVQGGLQKTPKRQPIENYYKYITVANVYRGYLKLGELGSFEATEDEFVRLKLEKDDLLIVEGNGSAQEIGRCAIWKNEIDNCIHQNHIIRSRPIAGIIINEYSMLFFNSNFGIQIMMEVASTTSGLYTLSVSKVNSLPLPLPPLEEQKEIVRQVDKLFAIADKLEEHYQKAKARVDKLSQSVLAKAFRGELVMPEAELAAIEGRDFESAEKLLERILQEKSAGKSR